MNVTVNIDIEKSKEYVWNVITDIDNAKNVISGIKDLKILEQPNDSIIGLKWTETREMFGKESSETMWITDAKENEYYITRAQSHGSVYITKLSVKEVGDKTLLTMDFRGEAQTFFVKVISVIMGIMIKSSMKKMMYKDLEDIKHYVEDRYV